MSTNHNQVRRGQKKEVVANSQLFFHRRNTGVKDLAETHSNFLTCWLTFAAVPIESRSAIHLCRILVRFRIFHATAERKRRIII
ncbi:MAG: hypothetical protein CMO55_01485 [Verrucomicrobiales bacterium]|nr:hypothetical protein [Verrucomicrobiales bacterium]